MAGKAVTGATEVRARLSFMKKSVPDGLLEAMHEAAKNIVEVSQSRTPVLTGALRDSHEILVSEQERSIRIIVGGTRAPYALYVHENLEAQHPDGGQAKFLESAFLEEDIPGVIRTKFDLAAAVKG